MAEHGALATLKDLAEKEVEDAARLLGEMRRGSIIRMNIAITSTAI